MSGEWDLMMSKILSRDGGKTVNMQDLQGKTAIMLAVQHGHFGMVTKLAGIPAVDLTIHDHYGMTVLMHGARWRDVGIEMTKAILLGVDRQSRTPFPTRQSLNLVQRVVNHQDRFGRTNLHHLFDAASDWGENASGFKARYMQDDGKPDNWMPEVSASIHELLQVQGIDLQLQEGWQNGAEGQEVVELAVEHGLKDVARTILAHPNYNPNRYLVKNDNYQTLLMACAESNNVELFNLMIDVYGQSEDSQGRLYLLKKNEIYVSSTERDGSDIKF